MTTSRPAAKVGIVFLGLLVGLLVACVSVYFRQLVNQGPEVQASSGMYAFSDLLFGVGIFAVLSLLPVGAGLFWLRPVPRFWTVLRWTAICFALTGWWALSMIVWMDQSTSNGIVLAQARIGVAPLTAMGFVTCGLFSPDVRHRWFLLGTAGSEAVVFAGFLLVNFVLPALRAN